MEYGIVHYGAAAYHDLSAPFPTCSIATSLSKEVIKNKWGVAGNGLHLLESDSELNPEDLFNFVKYAFEENKNTVLDVIFTQGYVASVDGTQPISAQKASRLYSGKQYIYVDELVLSSLFDYVSTYYIWAKDFKEIELSSFCFRHTVVLLNYSCRLGLLMHDEAISELVAQIAKRCDTNAVNFIADLYWSCLAFAFCHELAHIYLNHTSQISKAQGDFWRQEYEADAVGYDIYLQIIESANNYPKEPFAGVFHDYLYIAPMILFQFYEDTYFLSYWLFGQKAGSSHPPLRDRMNELLSISENEKYTFETHEGNIVLNNYMDISDFFRQQLILKLQYGKLNSIICKGAVYMETPGYKEVVEFQKKMCAELEQDAQASGIDRNLMIGLWNTAVDIELLQSPEENEFVMSYRNKMNSIKGYNIRFCVKKVLTSIIEFGASFQIPNGQIRMILTALLILQKMIEFTTISLNEEHAVVLRKCHEMNCYIIPIEEDVLMKETGCTNQTITELVNLGCLEIENGTIRLREKILFI